MWCRPSGFGCATFINHVECDRYIRKSILRVSFDFSVADKTQKFFIFLILISRGFWAREKNRFVTSHSKWCVTSHPPFLILFLFSLVKLIFNSLCCFLFYSTQMGCSPRLYFLPLHYSKYLFLTLVSFFPKNFLNRFFSFLWKKEAARYGWLFFFFFFVIFGLLRDTLFSIFNNSFVRKIAGFSTVGTAPYPYWIFQNFKTPKMSRVKSQEWGILKLILYSVFLSTETCSWFQSRREQKKSVSSLFSLRKKLKMLSTLKRTDRFAIRYFLRFYRVHNVTLDTE